MSNSTHSNVLYSNTLFKQYLMQLSTGIVWKNTSRANENESSDLSEIYQAELFVVANRGLLNFDVVKSFPRSVLLNASVTESNLEIYASDKNSIPVYLRDAIVKEYEKALTSVDPIYGRPAYKNSITGNYEIVYNESNNYYRMLMGLPNKEDTEYVYNTDLRWSTTTPIHEMTKVDRLEMERAGILDELLKKHPTKEYIAHLGKKYIDPFTARIADRFEIMYNSDTISDVLNDDFLNAYNSSRNTVLTVYYNNSFRKTNSLYDNFLAMCILFMTLQVMQYKYLQVDITRDFYDTESLKLVYDSYSVPFYNEIPLEYHQRIVKNINKLISYKGSSKVFFDLFDIFDTGSMDIYSYFLTKTHIIGDDGLPLFNLKTDADGNTMYDDEGHPILDESNYKINFSRIKINDDPSLSISDESNVVDYETITETDPYWIEDEELAKKLAGENFNYLESKYIGVQTIFDLMKITYENAYVFRLITDNKDMTSNLDIRWSEVGVNCSIFDMFIYLAALYCRFHGYEGIISNKIPTIMDTIGYNFEESSNIIRSRAVNNDIIQNNAELISLLMEMNVTTLNSVDSSYSNIEKISDIIISGYTNAKTLDEYNAYRELYNALLISKEITAVYTNTKTGEIYETFSDILSDRSPSLMQRYLLLDDAGIENEIIATIDKIDDILKSIKYLSMSSGLGQTAMIEPLFKILKFFKSAKAELVDYNILYTIKMRGSNFFKMLDMIVGISDEMNINDEAYFIDIMNTIYDMVKCKFDAIKTLEEVSDIRTRLYLTNYIEKITDEAKLFTEIIDSVYNEKTWYIDFVNMITSNVKIKSNMILQDKDDINISLLDILEAKYKETIKDITNTFTDYLKIII